VLLFPVAVPSGRSLTVCLLFPVDSICVCRRNPIRTTPKLLTPLKGCLFVLQFQVSLRGTHPIRGEFLTVWGPLGSLILGGGTAFPPPKQIFLLRSSVRRRPLPLSWPPTVRLVSFSKTPFFRKLPPRFSRRSLCQLSCTLFYPKNPSWIV